MSSSSSAETCGLSSGAGAFPALGNPCQGVWGRTGNSEFSVTYLCFDFDPGLQQTGTDKIVELVQVNLSPVELWTYTTDTGEKNARLTVQSSRPQWPMAVVVAALADKYPRGLTGEDLTHIDLDYVLGEQMAA